MEKRDFKQFDWSQITQITTLLIKIHVLEIVSAIQQELHTKPIMREWKNSRRTLPESIYVRVYDRNIDLMRAVIMERRHTLPRCSVLLFIAFPYDYPTHPPKVYYHSFGVRLNPNLYNNGLVLNERPFYNEPSNGTFRRFLPENKSNAYNEEVFTLTCSTTVRLIRKPPKHFEDFVRDHFRERAHDILSACDVCEWRVRVGYYNCNNSSKRRLGSSPSKVKVTPDFEKWATDSYPELIGTLQRFCGASVETPIKSFELPKMPSERNKDSGIFKKAMAKIKQALKWKNFGKKKKVISGTEESDDLRL
ncbi:Ubiquitin-conjugating enzyme E2 [Sesbania bispinosa]|nr:Ubiquitin-conjugating enzyme E2 [Sesbania bispinosa]